MLGKTQHISCYRIPTAVKFGAEHLFGISLLNILNYSEKSYLEKLYLTEVCLYKGNTHR